MGGRGRGRGREGDRYGQYGLWSRRRFHTQGTCPRFAGEDSSSCSFWTKWDWTWLRDFGLAGLMGFVFKYGQRRAAYGLEPSRLGKDLEEMEGFWENDRMTTFKCEISKNLLIIYNNLSQKFFCLDCDFGTSLFKWLFLNYYYLNIYFK